MSNIFVRVYYDSNNIRDASIWKLGLVTEESNMLYIETLHENVSDKLPEEKFVELAKDSYFKGLANVDTKLASIELVDKINGKGSTDINIYVNSDDNIRNKILSFIKKFNSTNEIVLIFKDSYEEVLFFDFIKDTLKDYDIKTMTIHNYICDPTDNYSKICEQSFNTSLEEVKDNEEMTSLLKYIKIVIECLILKDLFTYINK